MLVYDLAIRINLSVYILILRMSNQENYIALRRVLSVPWCHTKLYNIFKNYAGIYILHYINYAIIYILHPSMEFF